MAVKMQKPDYWPALREAEEKAQGQKKMDADRRKKIYREDCIRIRGAREHNLKNVDVDIPRNELVVLTGLSGSGKSSLAFDTIYAEGQRRYMESLSSYARQFLGQMEKPEVDKIEGLSPAISIDQKSTNRNPRSTVGTVTEIYDYFRLLYARIGIPHCPNCGRVIQKQTVDQMVDQVMKLPERTKILVLSPVVRGKKGRHEKILDHARRSGYVRVRIDGNQYDLSDEEITLDKNIKHSIEIIIDRLVVKEGIEKRLTDSLENALSLADGLAQVQVVDGELLQFSENFACPDCGISIPEIEPRSFSFNNPFGACPECAGIGYKMEFDKDLIIPDKTRSINQGAIAVIGWQSCMKEGSWSNALLQGLSEKYHFSLDTPWKDLPEEVTDVLLYGSPEEFDILYKSQTSVAKTRYRITFEGLLENTNRRYRETGGERTRQEYEQFMRISPCKSCGGKRLRKESLAVTVGGKNIYDVTCLSIRKLLDFLNGLSLSEQQQFIGEQILKEIRNRVTFLVNVGLEYLTLARATATLSGGEAQRIRLATQIGAGLMGVLYILDEPSIGLHQRDNDRLIATLQNLRDQGNTVIVVEHDEDTIRAADYVIDMGPGAGENGGAVVAAGTPEDIMHNPDSLTGAYLTGKKMIMLPDQRRNPRRGALKITGASANNLKNVSAKVEFGTLTVVTGVSGSGKSSLVTDTLAPALTNAVHRSKRPVGPYKKIEGVEEIDKVIDIDQSPIGRTPRSNPATYIGLWDDLRALFASVPESRARGYSAGRFSFNVPGGRCEACKGDGQIKIEMNFLPDVYVPCEVCGGKRYNRETLQILYHGKSISDVLDMTVTEALAFFSAIPKIKNKLKTLYDVGLGYVHLGQPATTLSGGEAQRVKLAKELHRQQTGRTFYILDEPTTGLHFEDVRQLIDVLERLVDAGNTVLVIEHNLDVIKMADRIIDLGPEGGEGGGTIVAYGTPEQVAQVEGSYTGKYLAPILERDRARMAKLK